MKQNHWFTPRDGEVEYFKKTASHHSQRELDVVIGAAHRGELTEQQFRQLVRADFMSAFAMRMIYCYEVSWAVYTTEWIHDIARMLKGQKVLEIGAGRGILGKVMPALTGAEWICTDPIPPEGADHVIAMRANRAVDQYDPDVVFASWVPYRSTLDYHMARRKPCVFVGETEWGCTGSTAFWREGEGQDFRVEYPDIQDVPQWSGIHDCTFRTFPTS